MSSCFFRQAFIRSSLAAIFCPLKPQQGIRKTHISFIRGQTAAYCFARLLVVWANRAVTIFALFRYVFFAHPFQRSLPCSFWSFLPPLTPQNNCLIPKQECRRSFVHFIPQATFIHSFTSSHLPKPTKKFTTLQKYAPALRFQRSRPQPSLQIALSFLNRFFPLVLSASATLSPLADGSRLSLRQAEKALHCVTPLFHLPSVGSRLFYLLCFSLCPRTAPDHPPLFNSGTIFFNNPIGLIFLYIAVVIVKKNI